MQRTPLASPSRLRWSRGNAGLTAQN